MRVVWIDVRSSWGLKNPIINFFILLPIPSILDNMAMKGQLSLEYLALSLIAILLISISLYALLAIRDLSSDLENDLRFRTTSMRLSNSIREACAMGSGNSRSTEATLPVDIDSEKADPGYAVRIKGGRSSYVFRSRCPVEAAKGLGKGLINAMNSGGSVQLKAQ